MPTTFSLILFLLLYFMSPSWDHLELSKRRKILMFLFFICVLIIGIRNPGYWIDTWAYVQSFYGSKTLATFSFTDNYAAYSEKGYYLLCVIIKTFSDSSLVYLSVIGLLSMTFFFTALRRYCVLPVLGLCIYIARYMLARDMNQMRAGLAISIVIAFTYLLSVGSKKNELKYILVCWLASFIHISMLAAIAIVIFNHIKLTKLWIYLGIVISFFVSAVFAPQIIDFISQSDIIQEMAKDYVDKEGESQNAFANDLTNPMIHYQWIILFVYTYLEDRIVPMTKYYFVFRNGYFLSTIILIILCQYAVLSARVSTIFATFEVFMIPLIIKALPKQLRILAYIGLLIPMYVFFMYNIR